MPSIAHIINSALTRRLYYGRMLTAHAFHAPLPAAVAPGTLSTAPGREGRLLMVQPREGKPSREVRDASRPLSGGDGSRGWATPPAPWPMGFGLMSFGAFFAGGLWWSLGLFLDAFAAAWVPSAGEVADGLGALFVLVAIVATVLLYSIGGF